MQALDTMPAPSSRHITLSSSPIIQASGLGKCYPIYERPMDRLLQALVPGGRKRYREFWALQDVSFDVGRGETIGVIGMNGSGKSTLLQLICGTLAPTTGTVHVSGRVAALLELGAGFNIEFSGRENVYLNASLFGLSREQVDARFDKIAAFADIGDFIDRPVKTYSSGMTVRLAFAVIVHVDADILIIDEALAVGDVFFTQKCIRFLRQFRETGTLFFVSHEMGTVLNLCDRALWLDHGRLVQIGPAKPVCEGYLKKLYDSQAAARQEAIAKVPVTRTSASASDAPIDPPDAAASAFGVGGARITATRLLDEHGVPLTVASGGEHVTLEIAANTNAELFSPMLGFFVKNPAGEPLFGENTFASTLGRPLTTAAGETLSARFSFVMPYLAPGDYTVTVAVAEGTQAEHIQHHWIHDALAFRMTAAERRHGLMHVMMDAVELTSSRNG